eukprot:SAG31_NODE_11859_length_991_cov_1.668161_2_plen_203_part_00
MDVIANAQCALCPDLEASAPRGISITLSRGTSVGSTATYSCDNGDAPSSGDAERICQPDGTWSGDAASCFVCDSQWGVVHDGYCYFLAGTSTTLSAIPVATACEQVYTGEGSGVETAPVAVFSNEQLRNGLIGKHRQNDVVTTNCCVHGADGTSTNWDNTHYFHDGHCNDPDGLIGGQWQFSEQCGDQNPDYHFLILCRVAH